MKKLLLITIAFAGLVSCDDMDSMPLPPAKQPEMNYVDLHDQTVKKGDLKQIDLDGDGSIDFFFNTINVGDPVFKQDKVFFCGNSTVTSNLFLNLEDRTPVYAKGAVIPLENAGGYQWHEVLQVIMAQKIIGETGPVQWIGDWFTSQHRYFPVQIKKGGLRYNGWFEISFSVANENLILHKAAVSKEPEKNILAGY